MHETHNIFGWRESGAVSESEALLSQAVPRSDPQRVTKAPARTRSRLLAGSET